MDDYGTTDTLSTVPVDEESGPAGEEPGVVDEYGTTDTLSTSPVDEEPGPAGEEPGPVGEEPNPSEFEDTQHIFDCSGISYYIPRDFGSSTDTAWLLIRQNPDVCKSYGVCPRDIEILLLNALERQSEHPQFAKSDIVGCLCPDSKCKPSPPIGDDSIKVVVDCCLECEDDCAICLLPLKNEMCSMTSCGHRFHRSCWFKIPEVSWGNWKPCPLCRTRISGRSYNIIRDRFRTWSNCKCCEHHIRRRPSEFSLRASYVEHPGRCSDPRAKAILELLFRKRESTPTCHCPCRSEMRSLCRLLI